ncbi:MAG: pyridoxamine 5'-phosphate oxidase family protein [Saprospiraceae bacterium]|nr:pyridoxamine 5'-phosphate oxidase family protein [Saprospiraceae bacterium]MCB9319301.1 pyridoxamine 5'-phosphate oxidase family protein [Lewinellaceae bacterium]
MKKNSIAQGSRYYPKRYDFSIEKRNAILDEGLVCHVGFIRDENPFVIPIAYCRIDDIIYLHGSVGSHFFMDMAKGIKLCITVTHLDALVLARSVMNHSMNYRSTVLFGTTRLVTDEKELKAATQAFVDHIIPGRWEDARQPTDKEMQKTTFIAVAIDEWSVKCREHGVGDDESDLDLPVWAGVMPVVMTWQPPVTDTGGTMQVEVPDYVTEYHR